MSQLIWVIIPAAGVGKRMQADCPKQYLPLAGETILDRTIGLFLAHPQVAGVAVGLSEEDDYWSESKWLEHPKVMTFIGGAERCDTVLQGLLFVQSQVSDQEQAVLVHDAARPLLSQASLTRIIEHSADHGALLAMPSRDTVKQQMSDTNQVLATLDRSHIWLAQTPQKFPLNALQNALQQAAEQGLTLTDECSAMELMGWQPDLVMGESSNIKVTLPEDLLIAEALFGHLQQNGQV
ncbi:2-C-methyl-D-erythritol 4-phosphate cytidylyltransferase [Marinomonas sp. THO17]|uniref:2-C-methyl-D-erythritol 4-phosphate cytidylyltransferase n=1 Tax=Marinomonas sp. THO17 TaxID=3149048 RepID=UPI00336C2C69